MSTEKTAEKTAETEYLRVPEVAALLRVPRSRAYQMVQDGDIPAVRISEKSIRVNRRDLEEHLRQRRTGPQSETDEGGGHDLKEKRTRDI